MFSTFAAALYGLAVGCLLLGVVTDAKVRFDMWNDQQWQARQAAIWNDRPNLEPDDQWPEWDAPTDELAAARNEAIDDWETDYMASQDPPQSPVKRR